MKKLQGWVIVGLAFMVLLQLGRILVTSNKSFEVVYSQATQIDGYEASPAAVRVYASPDIKWAEVSPLWKIAGWLCWLAVAAAAWYVGTDRHQGKKSIYQEGRGNAKGTVIIALPVLLCLVCWFAGYSSSLDQGSLVMGFDQFVTAFQIDEATQQKIIKEGGSGTTIKDVNGLLAGHFKH